MKKLLVSRLAAVLVAPTLLLAACGGGGGGDDGTLTPPSTFGASASFEGNPFEPLDDKAKAHLQQNVRAFYEMFVNDVARGRGVDAKVVRADPEGAEKHFGGGRLYPAKQAVALGMADRIETLDEVVTRLSKRSGQSGRSTAARRATL